MLFKKGGIIYNGSIIVKEGSKIKNGVFIVENGYSINDVIIIFDRARENIMKHSKKEFSYKDVLEDSIWQTFRRSIGTSLSTMLVLCSMFIFGTWVVQRFAFTVWVWVIASFLSSLFVAIPTAYILLRLTDKKIK